MRILRFLLIGLAFVVGLIALVWSAAALAFDLPLAAPYGRLMAGLWVVTAVVLWFLLRPRRVARLIVAGLLAAIVVWWFSLKPSNDRNWQPEVAELAWADIHGDEITVHNVRNFDYRSTSDFIRRWETRTVRLSELRGADIAINYWGSPLIAHPIVTFEFGNGEHLAFSIETRKEVGELYSAVKGFFRQYELIYLVADERDILRVRTNYRKGEDVYLYHLTLPPDALRARFMEYVTTLNQLREHPYWYNALTTNCTTAIRSQHPSHERSKFDWRMIANGKMDEMLYEDGAFDQTLPFAELKESVHINERAQAAGGSADFSRLIRESGGVPSSPETLPK